MQTFIVVFSLVMIFIYGMLFGRYLTMLELKPKKNKKGAK